MGDHCSLCGKPISDPASLARGMGPDCWAQTVEARQYRLDYQTKHIPTIWEKIAGKGKWGASMRGFIYRLGTKIKEAGERRRRPTLIRFGFWLRDKV